MPEQSLLTHPPLSPGVELIAGHRYRCRNGEVITLEISGWAPDWAGPGFTPARPRTISWWYGANRRGRPGEMNPSDPNSHGGCDAMDDGLAHDLVEDVTLSAALAPTAHPLPSNPVIGHRYRTRDGRTVELREPTPAHDRYNGSPIAFAYDCADGSRIPNWYVLTPTHNAPGRGAHFCHAYGIAGLDLVADLSAQTPRPFAVGDRVRAAATLVEAFADHRAAAEGGWEGVVIPYNHASRIEVRWDGVRPYPTSTYGEGRHEALELIQAAPHVPIVSTHLPRERTVAFKAVFSRASSTLEHVNKWDNFCRDSSPDLSRALALLCTPLPVADTVNGFRLALRTYHALSADVRREWSRHLRAPRATITPDPARINLWHRTRRLETVRSHLQHPSHLAALRSTLRVRHPSVGAVSRILHDPELRRAHDAEAVRIGGIRRERTDSRPPTTVIPTGRIAAMCESRKAARKGALRRFLVQSGIHTRSADALIPHTIHLARASNSYGTERLTLDSRAAVVSFYRDPEWRESILSGMRVAYATQFPRPAPSRGVRRPRVPNDRGMAVALRDPLCLFLTDERAWEMYTYTVEDVPYTQYNWNGLRRPSRMRVSFGTLPGTANATEGVYEVRSISGYHDTPRRFTGGLNPDICGIEIETAFRRPEGQDRGHVLAPGGWIVEQDSSIVTRDNEQATEIVSPPRPWAATIATTQGWFDACAEGGWTLRGGVSRKCGLHVTSSMPYAVVDPLHAMFLRMHEAGVYQAFSGRTATESLRYAEPGQEGKYSPTNVRRSEGNMSLVELRTFTGPTGDPEAYIMRIRMAQLIFAISNLEHATSYWNSATKDTGFLPVSLPAEFAENHADVIAYWKARVAARNTAAEAA